MKKQNFSKKATALIAALCIFAVTLGGTFAWYATAHAENIFTGEKEPTDPPPFLHDDYDPDTGEKDIYVENTGDKESTLYVRVKFEEFLDLTTKERPELILQEDWVVHKPIFSGTAFNGKHNTCTQKNAAGECFHDYFTWNWTAGEQKWFMPAGKQAEETVFDGYVQDTAIYNGTEDDVEQTPPAKVVSMDYYMAAERSNAWKAGYVGWIYDAADGWFYWSQPLNGGEVTSVLLSSVTTNTEKLKDNDYCYIIDVVMDAVDAEDLPMWTNGAGSAKDDTIKTDKASAQAIQALETIKNLGA